MSVTHIAGLAITVGRRVIQRCALCGAKLIDADLSRIMVPADQANEPYPTWAENSLVTVDGNATVLLSTDDGKGGATQLPADNCLPMVEQ